MATGSSARRALVNIGYSGSNSLSADSMSNYITGFTYVDAASGEADTASVELADYAMDWAGRYLPKKGDTFTAAINTYNWASDGDSKSLDFGKFCCDDRSLSFGDGNTATINGTSVPEKRDFRSCERSKTWQDVTIQEIASRIAGNYGLSLCYDAGSIHVEAEEQDNQDDCSFLKSLCDEYGLYMKVYSGKIAIYDPAIYEAKGPAITIDYQDIISGEYNSTLFGTYTGATIQYTAGSGTDKQEFTYTTGSAERLLHINEKVDNEGDAILKANARLKAENRKAETMRITVAISSSALRSSYCIQLVNAYEMSGKWFIDKATHKISARNGYTVDLDLHKVSGGGSSSAASADTAVTEEPAQEEFSLANLKVGDPVVVVGNAYYHGNGGTYNVCSGQVMYITEILSGSRYQYQYGVSKRKGGTRYGWCDGSSLSGA